MTLDLSAEMAGPGEQIPGRLFSTGKAVLIFPCGDRIIESSWHSTDLTTEECFFHDCGRILQINPGENGRVLRPRRQQSAARKTVCTARRPCYGTRPAQRGAARRCGGRIEVAWRSPCDGRRLPRKPRRGDHLPHAGHEILPAAAHCGAGARRGRHLRNGGVFRPLPMQNHRRNRQRRQNDNNDHPFKNSGKGGPKGACRRQHRYTAPAAPRRNRAGRRSGCRAFELSADFHAQKPRRRRGDEHFAEPPRYP